MGCLGRASKASLNQSKVTILESTDIGASSWNINPIHLPYCLLRQILTRYAIILFLFAVGRRYRSLGIGKACAGEAAKQDSTLKYAEGYSSQLYL